MKKTYLEFEKSIESIETKIDSLKAAQDDHPSIDINTELKQLENKADKSLHDIYDNLSAWQVSQVARHPQRPYTQDYIEHIFTGSVINFPLIDLKPLIFIGILVLIEWINRCQEHGLILIKIDSLILRWIIYVLIAFLILLFKGDNQGFIYFQF